MPEKKITENQWEKEAFIWAYKNVKWLENEIKCESKHEVKGQEIL